MESGQTVALLAEGVDRNTVPGCNMESGQTVALLAEGVDRNPKDPGESITTIVALLAEGVDRNRNAMYPEAEN